MMAGEGVKCRLTGLSFKDKKTFQLQHGSLLNLYLFKEGKKLIVGYIKNLKSYRVKAIMQKDSHAEDSSIIQGSSWIAG